MGRRGRSPGRLPLHRQAALVPSHPGDSWAPDFPGGLVRVSLLVDLEDLRATVTCWGADDTGAEWEAPLGDALVVYAAIALKPHCPRRETLLELWGFRPA